MSDVVDGAEGAEVNGAGAAGDGGSGGEPKVEENTFKAITSQDELDRVLKDRLARKDKQYSDYDDLKAKAAAFDKAEAERKKRERAQLSEEQRYQDDRKAWEEAQAAWEAEKADLAGRIQAFETDQLRAAVAAEKNVPAYLASRLRGSTREELEADADAAMAEFNNVSPGAPTRDKLNPAGGGNPPADEWGDFDPEKIADKFLYR